MASREPGTHRRIDGTIALPETAHRGACPGDCERPDIGTVERCGDDTGGRLPPENRQGTVRVGRPPIAHASPSEVLPHVPGVRRRSRRLAPWTRMASDRARPTALPTPSPGRMTLVGDKQLNDEAFRRFAERSQDVLYLSGSTLDPSSST